MTRWRTRPASRLHRIPAATNSAERPVEREGSGRASASPADSVKVFVWRRLAERAARFLHQVALDEDVDVAVEHAVDVADLLFRPVILGELIRVQHVAANLAAEADLLLDTADLVELGLVVSHLDVVEPRLQHLHRGIAVAVLRTLVLARHHEARRQMRDADGGVGDVDVLAAGTARSVSVDAEVFVFYLNVDILRQLRPGMKRRERRVTARRLIERGDADEPMDARLRREQAVRVLAGDRERHALEARLFARLVVDHLALE